MTNIKKQINHIINACKYSIQGIRTAFSEELAFRQDVFLFFLGSFLAVIMPITTELKLLLYISLILILISELINTAIEKTIDRIGLEFHELSKKAKDIGSAIVFVSLLNALFLWVFIFFKYVIFV